MDIEKAAARLRKGGVAVIYDGDGREGEADMVFHAGFAAPEKIETLRKDAGGLICLAIEKDIADRMGLPFYTEILSGSGFDIKAMECTKTAYKDRPSFAIAVNNRGVYTGITDNDRAMTIRKMAELAENRGDLKEGLIRDFYSPGHVFLLIGRGIRNRQGHTELALALANAAGMKGMMVLCEMLGSGKALSKENAKEYAEKNGCPFLEGKEIVEWLK
ncbi:3,4-dihydroxy-2-butanone-4-phosphate synthase [Candidatus Micrarchaeota archaeon]|nr:3,4-dihydroxy-2-butanone-4-phosphate synthase [Candidatus Micrarchaeota archaeon]